jgi:hypothetical protein
LASSCEAWAAVKYLADIGADPFQADELGQTSIHFGAIFGSFPKQAENLTLREAKVSRHLQLFHYTYTYIHICILKSIIIVG